MFADKKIIGISFTVDETQLWGPKCVRVWIVMSLANYLGFSKGRGTRDKLPTSVGSSKKQESSRKTSISALLTMPKPLTVWITINCGKF